MEVETITRKELSQSIAPKIGIPYDHAVKVLGKVLEIMMEGLARDGQLKLSSFGSFVILRKRNRVGRNPKTGQEIIIPPRKAISFRASDKLKRKVAKS